MCMPWACLHLGLFDIEGTTEQSRRTSTAIEKGDNMEASVIKGALCLEGGSLRGLFTAGVLDVFLEQDIHIEYVNGVSAGSMNGMNYVSRQAGRSKRINLKYVHDKRYISFMNMYRRRRIFNFDFLFEEISGKYDPFDWDCFLHGGQRLEVVATRCKTGAPAYFDRDHTKDFIAAVKASASIPVMSQMVDVAGKKYLDGGVSMPVAYERAFALGYKKAVVVLTREKGYRKKEPGVFTRRMYEKYFAPLPDFLEALREVPRRYNRMQEEMERLEQEGKLFIIRPPQKVVVKRLEQSRGKLEALYRQGREAAEEAKASLLEFL